MEFYSPPSDEAVVPDTAVAQGRTSANWAAFRTQPSLPVNTNVLSLEPLILVKGKEAAAVCWPKLQRKSNDRQLWHVILVRASRPNCLPLQRKPFLTPFRRWTDRASMQTGFQGGSLWPSVHLSSYSFGPKWERAPDNTEAILPPIYLTGTLHFTGPPAHGRERGFPRLGRLWTPGSNSVRAPGFERVGI